MMEVIKKINNNVAICVDSNGNELVAFGKGIGFPKTPYTLTDLSKISMTFYQIDYYYYSVLQNLPSEIIDLAVQIVDMAQKFLNKNLNPNLVFILADHINFAIYRLKKYGVLNELYSFEIEQKYHLESELANIVLKLINKTQNVALPKSEITSLTMHFVNAVMDFDNVEPVKSNEDVIIERIVEIISRFFDIDITTNSYNYHRLILHLRSYLFRIETNDQFNEDNSDLIYILKEKYPEIYECAKVISEYILKEKNINSSNDEVLYLMIHIRRVMNNKEENS